MLTLEFILIESNDPRIMSRINIYDKVQDELYKIKEGNGGVSFDELIEVTPSEQRCIAIIHYSELGDLRYDTID
jgi:hypothetical protein